MPDLLTHYATSLLIATRALTLAAPLRVKAKAIGIQWVNTPKRYRGKFVFVSW